MGGRRSGGGNRLSDAEKKKRGTFRADKSEAVYEAKEASTVVAGPWLAKIPDPEYPLRDVGRAKYDDLAKQMFDAGKLTSVTHLTLSTFCVLFQKIHTMMAEGREPSASDFTQMRGMLADLKIAEDAKVIANQDAKKNKFASAGFSNRRDASVRLLGPAKAAPRNRR